MKVHVVTLGFAPARILRQGIERLYQTRNKDLPVTHWLVDHHYPIDRETNKRKYSHIAEDYDLRLITPEKNLGLHGGMNWACAQIQPADNDIILMYDPDSYPLDLGWDMAIVRAMEGGGFSVIGTVSPTIETELATRGFTSHIVDGYLEVKQPKVDCQISISGWRWGFVSQVGGFSEPNAHYGGLEADMFQKLRNVGGKMGYVSQYREDFRLHDQHDPAYFQWKRDHAILQTFPGNFSDFIHSLERK